MAGEKILVVDDRRSIREAFLASFDDYRVDTVAAAQEALDVLTRPNDVDLIILDVMLPDFSGIELLVKIKKIDPRYKVIIFTGYSSKELVIEALRLDADDYIEKPFDVNIAREVIERLLLKKRQASQNDGFVNKFERAQSFIKRNYTKPLSLKSVAMEVSLSPKYFSRRFKEESGKSFNNYKIGLRMEMAKQLLLKNNYTISQIAFKVGYQNPESFIKVFKKSVGISPSKYRKKEKLKFR